MRNSIKCLIIPTALWKVEQYERHWNPKRLLKYNIDRIGSPLKGDYSDTKDVEKSEEYDIAKQRV